MKDGQITGEIQGEPKAMKYLDTMGRRTTRIPKKDAQVTGRKGRGEIGNTLINKSYH